MKHVKIMILILLAISLTASAYRSAYSVESQKIPILLYHHILDGSEYEGDNAFILRTEDFDAHMQYLYENGYHTITLETLNRFLYEKEPVPEKSVMIQFDDGYYSNITLAYPILKKYGFTAIIFVITEDSEILPQNPADPGRIITTLDMEDTRDVFEYASHTHRMHKPVDGQAALLLATQEEIVDDLRHSIALVDSQNALAYPHGKFDAHTIAAAKEAGITMAFTINKGYVTQNSNPYKLNRFTVYRDTSVQMLQKWVGNW